MSKGLTSPLNGSAGDRQGEILFADAENRDRPCEDIQLIVQPDFQIDRCRVKDGRNKCRCIETMQSLGKQKGQQERARSAKDRGQDAEPSGYMHRQGSPHLRSDDLNRE